jgi:chromosome segregation ATPase
VANRSDEASRLARLLGETEDLENCRSALLTRVDRLRSKLLTAGERTAAIRASVDLLCDHITEVITTAAELSVLESEAQEIRQVMEDTDSESSGLVFETNSLNEALDQADVELERLSARLMERKGKHSRGH